MSLYKTIKKNYSFLRYLEHQLIKKINLHGNVIDLGAKSENERYFEHLNLDAVNKLEFCDIFSDSENVKCINLEKQFTLRSDNYDSVLYFNVLEHIYNYQNVISETLRILKKGSNCHVIVPFMWHYHGDPDDFNRFTHTALYRKFTDAGFRSVKIFPIGHGYWNILVNLLYKRVPFIIFKFLILKIFMKIQNIEDKILGININYCLAYYIKAKK